METFARRLRRRAHPHFGAFERHFSKIFATFESDFVLDCTAFIATFVNKKHRPMDYKKPSASADGTIGQKTIGIGRTAPKK